MFRDHKRVTWRQRRLIRHLRRSRHASVQDAALHELHRSVRHSHGLKPPKAPQGSGHGVWRPLTRKAKALLGQLRRARAWKVKDRLLAEIAREMEHGRRLADRIAARARNIRKRAVRAGKRARARGRQFRGWARRAQERHLAWAERRQAERDAGRRRPPVSTRAKRKSREAARSLRARVKPRRSRPAPQARPGRVPQAIRHRTAASRPAPLTRPARTPRSPRPARTR